MARITFAVLPLASAAQSLTEEIRSILELHPQELRHGRDEVVARLYAAIDALEELVEAIERS